MPLIEAYRIDTGEKLPYLVPEAHLRVFAGALSATPPAAAEAVVEETAAPAAKPKTPKTAPDAGEKE